MKIRLTRPLAQAGRVIPAGVIISDAPPGLKERLLREGRAEAVLTGIEPPQAAGTADAAAGKNNGKAAKARKGRGKDV